MEQYNYISQLVEEVSKEISEQQINECQLATAEVQSQYDNYLPRPMRMVAFDQMI